jgi:hypothetical protein
VHQRNRQLVHNNEEETLLGRPRSYSSPGLPVPKPKAPKPYQAMSSNTAPLLVPTLLRTLEYEQEHSSIFETGRQARYIILLMGDVLSVALDYGWDAESEAGQWPFLYDAVDALMPDIRDYTSLGYMNSAVLNCPEAIIALILEVRDALHSYLTEQEANELAELEGEDPLRQFVMNIMCVRVCDSLSATIDLTGRYGFRIIDDEKGGWDCVPFRPAVNELPADDMMIWEAIQVFHAGFRAAVPDRALVPDLMKRDHVQLQDVGHQIRVDPDSLCPICNEAACNMETVGCGHRYCQDCLLGWANTNMPTEHITCPMDRCRLCDRPLLVEPWFRGIDPGQYARGYWLQYEVEFWVARLMGIW